MVRTKQKKPTIKQQEAYTFILLYDAWKESKRNLKVEEQKQKKNK